MLRTQTQELKKITAGDNMCWFGNLPIELTIDLIDQVKTQPGKSFFDIGSGAGQIVLLMALFTDKMCVGIELNEYLHNKALEASRSLGLQNVEFINSDARTVAYDKADMFYMFSPFYGPVLDEMFSKIEPLFKDKSRVMIGAGDFVERLKRTSWLKAVNDGDGFSKCGIFQ